MVVMHRDKFIKGIVLAAGFLVVLGIMFSPLFGGRNALQLADNLFNSISKGSADYLEDLESGVVAEHQATTCELSLSFEDEPAAAQARALVARAGARAGGDGRDMTFQGALGPVMSAALEDASALFHNRGEEVDRRYGVPGKTVLHAWWVLFRAMQRALQNQGRFAEVAALEEVITKGIEVAYNFHGIEAWKASAHLWVLTGALVFYVIYTLWWGYAILFLFDGFGLEMKAGAKHEM
jgi:hypothetical protein